MDLKPILRQIFFKCHSCSETSNAENVALKREEMDRITADLSKPQVVTVYCQHCGAANDVEVKPENLSKFDFSKLSGDLSKFLR